MPQRVRSAAPKAQALSILSFSGLSLLASQLAGTIAVASSPTKNYPHWQGSERSEPDKAECETDLVRARYCHANK